MARTSDTEPSWLYLELDRFGWIPHSVVYELNFERMTGMLYSYLHELH